MSTDAVSKYPPLTPQDLAEELGVPLTQRMKPDLSAAVPKRFVTLEEAKARGLSWYFTGSDVCRYGHNSARRTANPNICACCERVKDGKEPIYGKSRVQKYYEKPRRPSKDASAPVVLAAPIAPAQIEPSKKEQDFLTALDSTRSFEAAAEQTGFSRSQIEARASVNETFAKALNDLCERRQIPRTLKTPSTFAWSPEVERNLIRHFVDSGLLHTAREAVGCSASEYFAHLDADPEFAAAIEAARPLAAEQLREKSLHAASTGNIHLLKFLTDNAEGDTKISDMSVEQINAEIERLLSRFDAMGLFPTERYHKATGQLIDLRDYDYAPPDSSNLDLTGGQ